MTDEKILVVIPAFNEEERIGAVIRGVKQFLPEADLLVVNDGSQDRTAAVCSDAGALVVNHPFNLGVGTALQTGYKYALQKGYRYVIQLDADGQHDPSFLPLFVNKLRETEADLVIGSRFISANRDKPPFLRWVGNKVFAKILSVLIREKISDPTSGFRALKETVLRFCIRDVYGFDYPDADFLLTLHRAGFTIEEIPVEMHPRISGQSQHRGLRPVYYVIKMLLSIFVILLRKKTVHQE
jgi:hypothetical protein